MAKPTRTLGPRGVEKWWNIQRWNKFQRPYDRSAKYKGNKSLMLSYRFGEILPSAVLFAIIMLLVIIKVVYG